MKINQNILLLVAVIAIGIFMLPSTLSMFAGQHSWYRPNPDIEGIPCEKCHVLEENELMASNGPHSLLYTNLANVSANYSGNPGQNGSSTFWGIDDIKHRCFGCHQVGPNFPAGSGLESYNTNWDENRNKTHAAIVIQCVDCHPWVSHELVYDDGAGVSEAHRAFYISLNETTTVTNGTTLLKGANEACIACHTYVGVNITWTRAKYVAFNASVNTTSQSYEVKWNDSSPLGSIVNTTSYP